MVGLVLVSVPSRGLLMTCLLGLRLIALHLGSLVLVCGPSWVALVQTSCILLLLPATAEALKVLLPLHKGGMFLLDLPFVYLGSTDEVSAVDHLDGEMAWLETFFESLNLFKVSWLQ